MSHLPFKPLTLTDVLAVLSISKRTAETWLAAGKLPAPIRIGRRRLWHPDTFYAWLNAAFPAATASAEPDHTPKATVPARQNTPQLSATPRAKTPAPLKSGGTSGAAQQMRLASSRRLAELGL